MGIPIADQVLQDGPTDQRHARGRWRLGERRDGEELLETDAVPNSGDITPTC